MGISHLSSIREKKIYLLIVLVIILSFLSFFSVKSVEITILNNNIQKLSEMSFIALIVLPVYFFTVMFWAFKNFFVSYKKAAGINKLQIQYFFLGTFITALIGSVTNLALPVLFNYTKLSNIGPLSTIFFVISVSYAIIKHRFMDIRIVIRKSVVYFGALVTVILIGLGLMMLSIRTFHNVIPAMVSGPLVLLIGVVLFNPVKNLYLKIANKYFFTSLYSYQATLEDLAKKLTSIIEINKVNDLIVETMIKTMSLDRAGILLISKEKNSKRYNMAKVVGFNVENGIALVRDNFLVQWLEKYKNPVVYEEITHLIEEVKNTSEKSKLMRLKTNMKRIEASLCLPLIYKSKLIGIIVLGNKITKDAYTKEDLSLLELLSNQASIAIENARLYNNMEEKVDQQTREIKEKNVKLQKLLEIRSQFLDIASHQLRTPVSMIRGVLAMIRL